MSLVDVARLREIAERACAGSVVEAVIPDITERRIILTDGSVVDIWFSLTRSGRYSFHWERRAMDGKIYRHANAPQQRWQSVATFPRPFHNGSETNGAESHISEVPEEALREFLACVRDSMEAGTLEGHRCLMPRSWQLLRRRWRRSRASALPNYWQNSGRIN